VFERFYRADSARSSRDGGAGLGLAIARWIVELHGGDIRAERREPHGCRMVVRIPGRVEVHEPPGPILGPVSSSKSLSISERG
jgi:signal transduction histidine kinase